MYYLVGLGNPGEEYKLSRHNTGRIVLSEVMKRWKTDEMKEDKKIKALKTEAKIGREKVMIIFPETFMNKSGTSIKPLITSKKKAEKLIVIHDDLDLPLGKFKISIGKGSGGHRGVESIIKVVKTKDFIRIRVGISPSTPKGKIKKVKKEKVIDFIIGNFKPKELQTLKRLAKKIQESLEMIIEEGAEKAMSVYN